ncbi:MAG: tRNA (adenosine(37)-N6)-threonylcarbamoyltransferase complex ATPase subunit type 1 TsaE [Desulfobacterales bacterium]
MANQPHIPPGPWRITSRSPSTTRRLGYLLGRSASEGTVLALGGELGAGKTTLVQGLARGLEVPEEYYITSPTFTLINEYPGRRVLYHVDLYRLGDPDEALEIGLEEILAEGSGIVAIEWAERLGPLLPETRLLVKVGIEMAAESADQRLITLRGHGKAAQALMQTLQEKWRRAD